MLTVVTVLVFKKKQLNKLPELDYEEVMKIKTAAIRELYTLQKESFKDDLMYYHFF